MRARLEAVATWGKVSLPSENVPYEGHFFYEGRLSVDLDLALFNLVSTYDIVKRMTIQEKQKKYTREKGIQEKKDMNVK